MTHEPECPYREGSSVRAATCSHCHVIRAAYQRGADDPSAMWRKAADQEADAAYRRGYNDHARSVQHWQDTHGAYRQHGEGENP